MKNIFRILMAVAVLFTASCAKEDISSSIGGGEVEVTFTASIPELGTRAFGDGENATVLRYYVYDAASGEELDALSGITTRTAGQKFTFTLLMLKGMKYNISFWADTNVGTVDEPEGFYNFDGKVVTVSYDDANDNNRDAFYNYVEDFDPTTDEPSFKLSRPFAQLNAATNDLSIVANNEIALTTSTIKTKAPNKFDLTTGNVVANSVVDVAFTATNIPTETLKQDYTYLSMNYLLVPKAGMTQNVEFVFNGSGNGSNMTFTGTTFNDVPFKQNYRTNILGSLLSQTKDFSVEVVAAFDGERDEMKGVTYVGEVPYQDNTVLYKNAAGEYVEATTLAAAISAAPAGSVITLGAGVDVTLSATASTQINKNITISGISPEQSVVTGAVNPTAAFVSGGYTSPQVTLKNVTLKWNGVGEGAVVIKGEGKPTISLENCIIDANGVNPSGTNGVITLQKVYKVNIENCTFKGNSGTSWAIAQTIAGTADSYANITNCTFEGGGLLLTNGNGNVEYLKVVGNTFKGYRGIQIDDTANNKWQYVWIENNVGTASWKNWDANSNAENIYCKGNTKSNGTAWTGIPAKFTTEY